MKVSVAGVVWVFVLVSVAGAQSRSGRTIREEEVAYQNQCFQQWWETDLVWAFDELPTKGTVGKERMPYSGYYYPDGAGGTVWALRKYDRAFNRGRRGAAEYERMEILGNQERRPLGPFGLLAVRRTPEWHGHCNGWTAAAIRHAEPQRSVQRNGVVFTPADIKALLAELYIFSDTEFLGGVDAAINPGTLHVVLANWIGLGKYPVGMDTTIGQVAWNYPIYGYATSSAKRPNDQVEVKMNIGYAMSTGREYDKAPRNRRTMYFHYMLDLNEDGNVVGGRYFGDSARLDMLWVPLKPVQGGQKGNELGNPYLDVDTVLAIWRDSVPAEVRRHWLNIDPTDEDRVLEPEDDSVDRADAPTDSTSSEPAPTN